MNNSVARRIETALNTYAGTKTQTEIAKAIGFNSPNMLSMVKSGKVKLPLKRVPPLCRELGIPLEELLLLAMSEEYPEPEANPLWIAFGGRMPDAGELRDLMGRRP